MVYQKFPLWYKNLGLVYLFILFVKKLVTSHKKPRDAVIYAVSTGVVLISGAVESEVNLTVVQTSSFQNLFIFLVFTTVKIYRAMTESTCGSRVHV